RSNSMAFAPPQVGLLAYLTAIPHRRHRFGWLLDGEKRVGKRDRIERAELRILVDRGIDEEDHRHVHFFARRELLIREAEALQLVEIAGGFGRRDVVGRDALAFLPAEGFRRVMEKLVSPIWMRIGFSSGAKCQGSPPATLPSKRTLIVRAIGAAGASFATIGVPPKPVVR